MSSIKRHERPVWRLLVRSPLRNDLQAEASEEAKAKRQSEMDQAEIAGKLVEQTCYVQDLLQSQLTCHKEFSESISRMLKESFEEEEFLSD